MAEDFEKMIEEHTKHINELQTEFAKFQKGLKVSIKKSTDNAETLTKTQASIGNINKKITEIFDEMSRISDLKEESSKIDNQPIDEKKIEEIIDNYIYGDTLKNAIKNYVGENRVSNQKKYRKKSSFKDKFKFLISKKTIIFSSSVFILITAFFTFFNFGIVSKYFPNLSINSNTKNAIENMIGKKYVKYPIKIKKGALILLLKNGQKPVKKRISRTMIYGEKNGYTVIYEKLGGRAYFSVSKNEILIRIQPKDVKVLR